MQKNKKSFASKNLSETGIKKEEKNIYEKVLKEGE